MSIIRNSELLIDRQKDRGGSAGGAEFSLRYDIAIRMYFRRKKEIH